MNGKRNIISSALTILILGTSQGVAHPGHGKSNGFNLLHFITEPEHLIPTLVAIAAVVGIVAWRRKKTRVVE